MEKDQDDIKQEKIQEVYDEFSEEFLEELAAYQLVIDGVFTPHDLRTTVTLEDIHKCMAAIEIKNRVEEILHDIPSDKE